MNGPVRRSSEPSCRSRGGRLQITSKLGVQVSCADGKDGYGVGQLLPTTADMRVGRRNGHCLVRLDEKRGGPNWDESFRVGIHDATDSSVNCFKAAVLSGDGYRKRARTSRGDACRRAESMLVEPLSHHRDRSRRMIRPGGSRSTHITPLCVRACVFGVLPTNTGDRASSTNRWLIRSPPESRPVRHHGRLGPQRRPGSVRVVLTHWPDEIFDSPEKQPSRPPHTSRRRRPSSVSCVSYSNRESRRTASYEAIRKARRHPPSGDTCAVGRGTMAHLLP